MLEGLAGLVVGAAALWGVLLLGLFAAISSERPDPTVPPGDPCCDTPDDWAEVAEGAAWTGGAAILDGALFALAAALVLHAVGQRWPRRRWLVAGPLLYALVAVATIGVAQVAQAV